VKTDIETVDLYSWNFNVNELERFVKAFSFSHFFIYSFITNKRLGTVILFELLLNLRFGYILSLLD